MSRITCLRWVRATASCSALAADEAAVAVGAVGVGDRDAGIFVWSLQWWPHAIGRLANPLYTHALFAPGGADLAWATTLPGPAVLLAPVTLLLGAARTFDLLMVLSPVLAAWTAYLLCRRLTGAFLP